MSKRLISLITVSLIVTFLLTKSCYIDTYDIAGKVQRKLLAPAGSGTTYVIVLEDGRLLEIQRNLWYGDSKYNEDRLFAQVIEGENYVFTCWGWQFDFSGWYMYPNVIALRT
jgi:hypothetical protein